MFQSPEVIPVRNRDVRDLISRLTSNLKFLSFIPPWE